MSDTWRVALFGALAVLLHLLLYWQNRARYRTRVDFMSQLPVQLSTWRIRSDLRFRRLAAFALAFLTVSALPLFAVRVGMLVCSRLASLIRTATVHSVLDAWGTLLPVRIANEDLGGFIEDIQRRKAAGQVYQPRIQVVGAMFWTSVASVGYLLQQLRSGKKSA